MTDIERIRIMTEEMMLPEIRVRRKGLTDLLEDQIQIIMQENEYAVIDVSESEIVWKKRGTWEGSGDDKE